MKKLFKSYLIIWVAILALFNVIAFVAPALLTEEKYTASFWIGYIFITVTMLGQLACAYIALKEDNLNKTFYNISLLRASYTGLIVSFIVGALCMLIPPLPYWIGIIACSIVLVVNVIVVLKAKAAADVVSHIDEKIKVQTFFIKSLTVDADTLVASAKSDEAKAECRKVYEAVRYSDPMSNDALASVESQITIKFAELSDAVSKDNIDEIKSAANTVLILVRDRNNKCKILK